MIKKSFLVIILSLFLINLVNAGCLMSDTNFDGIKETPVYSMDPGSLSTAKIEFDKEYSERSFNDRWVRTEVPYAPYDTLSFKYDTDTVSLIGCETEDGKRGAIASWRIELIEKGSDKSYGKIDFVPGYGTHLDSNKFARYKGEFKFRLDSKEHICPGNCQWPDNDYYASGIIDSNELFDEFIEAVNNGKNFEVKISSILVETYPYPIDDDSDSNIPISLPLTTCVKVRGSGDRSFAFVAASGTNMLSPSGFDKNSITASNLINEEGYVNERNYNSYGGQTYISMESDKSKTDLLYNRLIYVTEQNALGLIGTAPFESYKYDFSFSADLTKNSFSLSSEENVETYSCDASVYVRLVSLPDEYYDTREFGEGKKPFLYTKDYYDSLDYPEKYNYNIFERKGGIFYHLFSEESNRSFAFIEIFDYYTPYTFIHEVGHFIADLDDEYFLVGSDEINFKNKNCVSSDPSDAKGNFFDYYLDYQHKRYYPQRGCGVGCTDCIKPSSDSIMNGGIGVFNVLSCGYIDAILSGRGNGDDALIQSANICLNKYNNGQVIKPSHG